MKSNKIISENLPLIILANSTVPTEKVWIMNAEGEELIKMLLAFCQELDDYIQIAADAGDNYWSNYFESDYKVVEGLYLRIKNEGKSLSLEERSSIRSIMKFNTKQALTYSC